MPDAENNAVPRRKRAAKKRFHTRLHRWLGTGSLGIVLIISVTGILLNHTATLRLDERSVTWSPLLHRYGMEPKGEPVVFPAGEDRVAVWDGRLFVNDLLVETLPETRVPVGAGRMESEDLFVFAFPDLIVTADPQGQVFDRIDVASLPPSPLSRVAAGEGELILETEDGKRRALRDWIDLVEVEGGDPRWFRQDSTVPSDYRQELARALRGDGMPLYRVVLDLHSGRLFGTVGVILWDLAAVALVVLGITGVMLWFRRR